MTGKLLEEQDVEEIPGDLDFKGVGFGHKMQSNFGTVHCNCIVLSSTKF